jgi:hypothetical protein
MFRDRPEVSRLSVGASIQCGSIWHSSLEGEGMFSGHFGPLSVMELAIPPASARALAARPA